MFRTASGIRVVSHNEGLWIPAYAGMTVEDRSIVHNCGKIVSSASIAPVQNGLRQFGETTLIRDS